MRRRTVNKIIFAWGISWLVPNFSQAAKGVEASKNASFAVMDPRTNKIIVEQDAHFRRPVASLTKLMTALVVFDAMILPGVGFGLNSIVTIPREVEDIHHLLKAFRPQEDGTGLSVGDEVKAELLLTAMGSRSDAASTVSLAVHTASLVSDHPAELQPDKLEKFVRTMNLKAQEIGMKDTNFENVTGEHAKTQLSTAADIALLLGYLQKTHPIFMALAFGRKEFDLKPVSIEGRHSSALLHWYPNYVKWAKTGILKAAGHCLAACYEKNGELLVGVVLGEVGDKERNRVMFDILGVGYNLMGRKSVTELKP